MGEFLPFVAEISVPSLFSKLNMKYISVFFMKTYFIHIFIFPGKLRDSEGQWGPRIRRRYGLFAIYQTHVQIRQRPSTYCH